MINTTNNVLIENSFQIIRRDLYLPGNFFVRNDAFVIIDLDTVGIGFTEDKATPKESPGCPEKTFYFSICR